MKYYKQNNIHIMECSVDELSIELVSEPKKNIKYDSYVNANFFGNYSEKGEKFTLPAGHLVADFNSDSYYCKYYCSQRGKFIGNKLYFDAGKWSGDKQFYGKNLTSLIIENGKARIDEIKTLNDNYSYAVSGIPVIRNGNDVKFKIDVIGQGYDGGTLYATKHIFVGLKKNDSKVYIMGYKTTSSNLIYSAEMYKKIIAMGFYDVIKLDGGGSYHFKTNGVVKDTMSENRRINAIIKVTPKIEYETNPEVSSYAKKSWDKAVKKGIISNDNPKGVVTREMLMFIEDKLGNL